MITLRNPLILLFLLLWSLYSSVFEPAYDLLIRKFNKIHFKIAPYAEQAAKLIEVQDMDRYKKLTSGFMRNRKGNEIGMCYPVKIPNGYPEITVYSPWWDFASRVQKEELMMHEIGHCVCFLQHGWVNEKGSGSYRIAKNETLPEELKDYEKYGYFNDGCPMSVMYPKEMGEYCYLKRKQYYIEEIKKRCERIKKWQQ